MCHFCLVLQTQKVHSLFADSHAALPAAASPWLLQPADWQVGPGLVLWTLAPQFACDLHTFTVEAHAYMAPVHVKPVSRGTVRQMPLSPMLHLAKDVSEGGETIVRT